MSRPVAIDLFCGLGGWTEGLLAEGYHARGYDIEAHEYDGERYPGELILADVMSLHGSQFADATLIVASPPCQEYSYMAMPWTRAKAKAAAIRADVTGAELQRLNTLFNCCFRLQREASEAAGRHVPMVVENVRGAVPWVGAAAWNFGSYYLWGDVPALMPATIKATKNPGFRFDGSGKSFQTESVARHVMVELAQDGRKQKGSGRDWFAGEGSIGRTTGSKSAARKAASARIAKIPLPLSSWIARTYKPKAEAA